MVWSIGYIKKLEKPIVTGLKVSLFRNNYLLPV